MTQRRTAPSPYDFLPQVGSFALRSKDVEDREPLPDVHTFDGFGMSGGNLSPHLQWEGFPGETKGFAVTCYDPDAPTGSGFWHWILFNISADVTELERGAGTEPMEGLPAGAVHALNDVGTKGFAGAAPPVGHGPHRYIFAVHALDVEQLEAGSDTPPALVRFEITNYTLARAVIAPTYER